VPTKLHKFCTNECEKDKTQIKSVLKKQMATSPSLLLEVLLLYHGPLRTVQVPAICILPLLHLQPQAEHTAKELAALLPPVLIHGPSSNSAQSHQLVSGAYTQKMH
jgi:hypothetical protein